MSKSAKGSRSDAAPLPSRGRQNTPAALTPGEYFERARNARTIEDYLALGYTEAGAQAMVESKPPEPSEALIERAASDPVTPLVERGCVVISGGVADWIFRKHHFTDFVVGDEHTVFEWCKIYIDQNPNATPPEFLEATAERQEDRLTFLGAIGSNVPGLRPHPTEPRKGIWDDNAPYRTANAIYRELADGIESGRIRVKKLVYLDDRPDKRDLTLCVIDVAPVLEIARRREDYGQAIAMMLAEREQQAGSETGGAAPAAAELPPPTERQASGETAHTEVGMSAAAGGLTVIHEAAKPKTVTRGRKPGSGEIDDSADVRGMLRLLASGKSRSVWNAAGRFSNGTVSTQRRLARKFRLGFGGTSPPPGKAWKDVEQELNTN